MAGYSGTPLAQKLGIKPEMIVGLINAPVNYKALLKRTAGDVAFSDTIQRGASFVHFFTTDRGELKQKLSTLRQKITDDGTIWVSWPKKTARVATDVTEDVIRSIALPLGLVDVKVCAIDETWSGLKLMVRRENRKRAAK